MEYYLESRTAWDDQKIHLTEHQYNEIISSWDNILLFIAIEEEWEKAVQNYSELEAEILKIALAYNLHSDMSHQSFHEDRLRVTRRLFNLLQACKSYMDQTESRSKSIAGNEMRDAFNSSRQKAYDSNFSYRFMEELRKHAQHRGMPMHGISRGGGWIDFDEESASVKLRIYASGLSPVRPYGTKVGNCIREDFDFI